MLPPKDTGEEEEGGNDPGDDDHEDDTVLGTPGAVASGNFDGTEPIDRDEEDCVLGDEADGVVHREPEVTEDGAKVPRADEDIDGVEGHGHDPNKEVCGGEGGDEVVGGLSDPTVHDEGEEDEDVPANGQDHTDPNAGRNEDCEPEGEGWDVGLGPIRPVQVPRDITLPTLTKDRTVKGKGRFGAELDHSPRLLRLRPEKQTVETNLKYYFFKIDLFIF